MICGPQSWVILTLDKVILHIYLIAFTFILSGEMKNSLFLITNATPSGSRAVRWSHESFPILLHNIIQQTK